MSRDGWQPPAPAQLEVRRIARLLSVEPAELAGLDAAAVEDLRALREQIAGALFDRGADSWERVAAVAGAVPAGLAAKLAQGALGPVLAARVTGRLDTGKAAEIARKLPPAFMADTAVHLDPRHVTELLVQLPPETIADVGAALAQRGEWLVMADFVAAVGAPALRTTVQALDGEALLRTAVLLEDPARIAQVVSLLDDARLADLREVAAQRGLQDHLAAVAAACDPAQRARLEG